MQKFVSFDLWGTLIKSNPAYKAQRNQLLCDVFECNLDPKLSRTGKEFVDNIGDITGQQMSYEMIIALVLGSEIIKTIDKNTFLQKVQLFSEKNENLLLECHPLILNDQIVPMLDRLIANAIHMNVISNTSIIKGISLERTLITLDIKKYFDFLIFSDQVGMCKPNVAIYHLALTNIEKNVNCAHSLFHVGDNIVTDNGGNIFTPINITSDNIYDKVINRLEI